MFEQNLNRVNLRLNQTLARHRRLQKTTNVLRRSLGINRVVVYYFYRPWRGQVVIESLSHNRFSILGSTGADDCFNHEYAQWYLQGRIAIISNVEEARLEQCHLDFLRSIQVRSNLVVPIIVTGSLWGLLAAHHNKVREWSDAEVNMMSEKAKFLGDSPVMMQ